MQIKKKCIHLKLLKKDHGLKVDKELPWFKALENIPPSKEFTLRAVLRRGENIKHEPRIKLSTIHGSKVVEADNVMLLTDLTRKADEEYWRHRDSRKKSFLCGYDACKKHFKHSSRSQSDREFSEVF